LIRSYRRRPVRSKRGRLTRVWSADQDGHRACGLLYLTAVPVDLRRQVLCARDACNRRRHGEGVVSKGTGLLAAAGHTDEVIYDLTPASAADRSTLLRKTIARVHRQS